jgi:uncharacterized protein
MDTLTDTRQLAAAIDRLTAELAQHRAAAPVGLDLDGPGPFVWRDGLARAVSTHALPLDLLLGVERQKGRLLANLAQFAAGLPANHALLWGAPGTGKSALVKAACAAVAQNHRQLALVEVPREATGTIGPLLEAIEAGDRPVVLFIDDLSFTPSDHAYRTLKSVLDGGLAARPGTGRVLVIVTSNLRHLIDRQAMEAGQATSQRPDEAAYEQLALSDRFGLWLGFHPMDQPTFLAIVRAYCGRFDLAPDDPGLERAALQWVAMRGSRSGRAAWQFVADRAGMMGRALHW